MSPATVPTVYILHGTDDFALGEYTASLKKKLGDPATADLNTTVLDGRSLSLADLRGTVGVMPFLAKRRLVIVENLVARLMGKGEDDSESGGGSPAPGRHALKELIEVLASVPETTALVLAERRELSPGNAVLKWVAASGGQGVTKLFAVPKGAELSQWILARARSLGGAFRPQAAQLLASAVGDDPRLAAQEILKLLTFVNFERPVEPDDVELLTPYTAETSVFAMVDALGQQNGRRALELLRQLLRDQDPAYVFTMIVRQFRLLLLARELMDAHATEREIVEALHVQPFVAGKLMAQAKSHALEDLEWIYRKLLDVDLAIKTGQIDGDVALDTLVVGLTG